jgi:RNA polymerase sigma factor (sigma-70 family)
MNKIEISDALIEKWEPKIHRMLATTSVQGMHKEDLVQELRIVILKAAKKFNPNKKTSFHTYLHTAMINTIRTFISQAQKRIHPTTINTLINYSEYEYISSKIAKALEDVKALAFLEEIEIFDILDNLNLTEKEKRYIELRFEDLTMTEISEDLEESAYRVRNKIRKKFENLYKEKITDAS